MVPSSYLSPFFNNLTFVVLPSLIVLNPTHLISKFRRSSTMLRISFLQLLFVTLLALSAVFAADAVQGTSSSESFQEALDIKAVKLHDALHALSAKFRHGIFPTDIQAAEALQAEEPTIASLIKLAKRQDNATTPATVPTVTTATSESASEPATTSAAETSQTSETTSASNTEPTTSAQPTVTSATSASETSTSEPTSEPTSETTRETSSATSASVPTETPSTVSTQTTAQPTTTTTESSTAETTRTTQTTTSVPSTLSTTRSTSSTSTTSHQSTTTHATSLSTSTFESTTTLPDGSLSTITSITVITPSATGGAAAATTAGKPGLQTNVAAMATGMAREVVAIVGGAVVVAMAL